MKIDPRKFDKRVFVSCFILNCGGMLRIPGSEPVQLDLKKLFLLSVSKENLDFRGKNEKSLP